MRAVLGIDAAWTRDHPSGVALVAGDSGSWRLIAAAPSYRHFHTLTGDAAQNKERPAGSTPDVSQLLASASALCGCSIDLVAVDMPLALSPIRGRRESDNTVSSAYGSRKCGTHTPSASRPGRLSGELRGGFERAGYPLQTGTSVPPRMPGLIEAYPHPALVELASAPERLPYKLSKVRSYWPSLSPSGRRKRLYREWRNIVNLLETKIGGVTAALREPGVYAVGWEAKAYEDTLDAVICAWVAICALEGQATPFGAEGTNDSAIWIPIPQAAK